MRYYSYAITEQMMAVFSLHLKENFRYWVYIWKAVLSSLLLFSFKASLVSEAILFDQNI